MAIFKKQSPLEGNLCMPSGVALEFTGMYFETEDEAQLEYIRGFKNYVEVEARDEVIEAKPTPKAATGIMNAAKLAGLAAQNK